MICHVLVSTVYESVYALPPMAYVFVTELCIIHIIDNRFISVKRTNKEFYMCKLVSYILFVARDAQISLQSSDKQLREIIKSNLQY